MVNIKNDVEFIKFKEKLYNVKHEVRLFFKDWDEEKVNNLETPQQLSKYGKAIGILQWGGRLAATAGGILSLTNHPVVGGSIAVVCPLIESFSSNYKENNAEKKREWEKFAKDAKKLWDAYYRYSESEDVVKPIEDKAHAFSESELVEKLEDLKDKATDFISEVRAEDGISALGSNTKEEFPQRLRNNWKSGKGQIERVEKAIVIFLEWAENLNSTTEVVTQREEIKLNLEAHTMRNPTRNT